MAEILKDKLRSASFRGVPFQVDASGFETGRRTQVHEYPQRDKPYSQDMGRSTRHIDFDAFVIGSDYVEKTNAVLGAMEEFGAGALVHPWFGSLNVNVLNCKVAFDRDLGLARLSLSFVEAGELAFPSSASSTAALSRTAAAGLETESVSAFAQAFSVLKQISDAADKALTVYGNVLNFLSNPVFALSSALGFGALPGNINSLFSLFGAPLDLGWNFAGLVNLSNKVYRGQVTSTPPNSTSASSVPSNMIARDDVTLIPTVRGLTRMATDPILAHVQTGTGTVYATASPTRRRIIDNQNAINANTRQLLLVQACGLSSYLKCSIYDDILAVKNELAEALDAEALQVTDDTLYQALMTARAAMWLDLTERSRDSARLSAITPDEVTPALTVAYDYYEDAGRDSEIVARNKIHHPGFVPVKPLLVLSR